MSPRGWAHVVALLGAFVPGVVSAQEVLSLSQAQAEARTHAPEVAALKAELEAAEVLAREGSRIFRQDPVLTGRYSPGALVHSSEESAASVGVEWQVDVAGTWGPRGRAAGAERERAQAQGEDGLYALDEAVAEAVAELALAQRAEVRAERLASFQHVSVEAARKQLEVGKGSGFEVDAAELDEAAARAALEAAQGNVRRTRMSLARLLGRDVLQPLRVEDPPEEAPALPPLDSSLAGAHDPRIRAAAAELRAAEAEGATAERALWPMPTLGLEYVAQTREIPAGSFMGPGAEDLSARWREHELSFSLSLPLPLLDRQREPRARATVRLLRAQAAMQAAEAEVRLELATAWSDLEAARRSLLALSATADAIDRGYAVLEQAVRAGALDSVARAQSLRRLEEAGRLLDEATRDYRVARARWIRRHRAGTLSP